MTALPDIPGGGTEGVEILRTQNDALPPAAAVQRYENTGDGTQVVNLNGDLAVHNHIEFPPELLQACVDQLGIQMSKMMQAASDAQPQNTVPTAPSHAIEWASLSFGNVLPVRPSKRRLQWLLLFDGHKQVIGKIHKRRIQEEIQETGSGCHSRHKADALHFCQEKQDLQVHGIRPPRGTWADN